MTAPAHPLVFRPIIERLRAGGDEVVVTARDYAQTLGLLERMGIEFTAVGKHGGASRVRKLGALVGRTSRVRRLARKDHFDLAVAHGSNDLALAAASLAHPRRQHLRLRVGHPAAPDRLPAGAPRDGARGHPARAAAPLRRRPATSCASTRG